MDCPKCRADLADLAAECPRCGIIVAKYREDPVPRSAQLPDVESETQHSSVFVSYSRNDGLELVRRLPTVVEGDTRGRVHVVDPID